MNRAAVCDFLDQATDHDLVHVLGAAQEEAARRNAQPAEAWQVAGWDPWRALREAGQRIDWAYADLAPGVEGRSYPLAPLIVTPRAGIEVAGALAGDPRQVAHVVTHELVHCERRFWFTPGEAADVIEAEEAEVERLTVERMAAWTPGAAR